MPLANAFDFFIQLHLTERCNLRCSHCYQTGRHTDEMSFPEIKGIINEVAGTLKVWKESYDIDYAPSFNVTGGEPFLRNDMPDILRELKDAGFAVYLLTNGILIGENQAATLSHIGVNGVQVSIEGPEDIHESIRGKGSFEGSMRGIRHLLDKGLQVTLNVTLSSVNAHYFMDIVTIAQNAGVQKVGFSRLVPSGRGRDLLKEMLSKEDVRDFYQKIFSFDTGNPQIVTGDPIASQFRNNDQDDANINIPIGGCAAGISGLTVLPDGTMVPCRRLPVPIGNIRTDTLREVWATSEVLEAIRDRKRYQGKCGACRRWSQCRGCRAIAYAFSQAMGKNDYLAEDPQCFFE